jgi:hypothetical protein
VKIELDIPPKRIADLMITAIEGGIAYWCSGVYLRGAWQTNAAELESPWYSDAKLYAGQFTIEIVEHEEHKPGAGNKHRRNQDDFAKGLALMATRYGRHFGDFMAENEDATTADVFLQCVALNDVVYG